MIKHCLAICYPLHTCRMCLGEHVAICHAARWSACNIFGSNKSTVLIITTVSWYKQVSY